MESQKETWKYVSGYEGMYRISSYGRVMSISRIVKAPQGIRQIKDRFIKLRLAKRGYYTANLHNGSGYKTMLVHRMVAEAFIHNYENKKTVNHKDGNKLNNHADNLEWATKSEQGIHAYKLGLKKKVSFTSSKNGHAKAVVQKDLNDNIIKRWPCARDAAREGWDYKGISGCVTGRRKTYAKFKWEYDNNSIDNSGSNL